MTLAETLDLYDRDSLTPAEIVTMFSDLVANGTIYGLSDRYRNTAMNMVDADLLTYEGEVTDHAKALVPEL
jgi:hypothetical protein